MGGGLMQLVAYGAQDIYLTGNPQITFFKVVYRRHTNFSMESIKQTFDGNADFGGDVVATISRNGDLVHKMYLEHDVLLSCTDGNEKYLVICTNYGSNLIKECEIEIGGQRIDKHYSHWHSVYSQLNEFNPTGYHENGIKHIDSGGEQVTHFANSIYRSTLFNTMSGNGGAVTSGVSLTDNDSVADRGSWSKLTHSGTTGDTSQTKIFIPLYFWFCRNPGLALPLIALQYHEVKIKMTFENIDNLAHECAESDAGSKEDNSFFGDTITDPDYIEYSTVESVTNKRFDLWCDYIYLDTDERRRFAQVSHEYLIEQLQFSNHSGNTTIDLNFNHPVKELIWTSNRNINDSSINIFKPSASLTGGDTNGVKQHKNIKNREPRSLSGNFLLKLNGHDRFKSRDTKYFTRTQVWQNHTGYGSTINSDGIAVYSFALKPEEHQPSGTCNFSRIDSAELISSDETNLNIYAVNYNVLRIMSGMGGLAYSN